MTPHADDLAPSGYVDPFDHLAGGGSGLRPAVEQARRLSKVDAPLLVHGETGVGKEVFARAIHDNGPHGSGPFVALNCGALPRDLLASELFGYVDGAFSGARRTGMIGKIEAAHGGTLFLDEVAEMPLDLQPYLLRVLEQGEICPLGTNQPRKVSFRLVSASNRDLRAEVSAAHFRMDLFYRVSVTSLRIPPLRERKQDLSGLVERFAAALADRHGLPAKRFAPEVLSAFARYSWPGNVRELRNVVEAMILLAEGDVVARSMLPQELTPLETEGNGSAVIAEHHEYGLRQVERDAIDAAIKTHRGNLTVVARCLRISRSTLYLKMKRYSLEPVLSEVRLASR